MRAWTHWQSWVILVLSVILLISPWIFGTFSHAASSWAAWILGLIGVILALWPLRLPTSHITAEWLTIVLGIVLFISPWVFGFASLGPAAWTAWIIGLLLVIAAGWSILESRTPREALV